MAFFRKMFGSKNRKNFKPGVEPKQTVDGQKTDEKYRTYDEKKQHEAELWAKLILKGIPEYTESNAKSLRLRYISDKNDPEYSLTEHYYYAVAGLKMLIPDNNCCVCRLSETVKLTTLYQKESKHSGTVRFLKTMERRCLSDPAMIPKWLGGTVFMLADHAERTWEPFLEPHLRSEFAKCGKESLLRYLGKELEREKSKLSDAWEGPLQYYLNTLTEKKLADQTYHLLDRYK